jgi:alcohol dehydrogenase class IV
MVKPFRFARLPQIVFGCGKLPDLQSLIDSYGSSVILLTGKNSFLNSSHGEFITSAFEKNRISYKHLIVSGEPSPEMVDEAVMECSREKYNSVVAIGGGSVIDAGKAISAMMYKPETVVDFLEVVGHKDHPGTKLPFIAVPTTSGTGSEATKNSVLSRVGKDGFKRSLRHDNIVPDIALVDPELTLGCPPDITAASGMDCFTQLTEAFLSDKSCEYTDALAIEGLKQIKISLKESYADGNNIEARTGMSFAALTSGICLANAGLGVVHGFASSIGGLYNIPHGLVCGTLMAVSNELTVRKLRKNNDNTVALKKYALLGELFLGESNKSEDYYIDSFIEYLFQMTSELKLPGLIKCGIDEKEIGIICSQTENKNNPAKLNGEDLAEILHRRLY